MTCTPEDSNKVVLSWTALYCDGFWFVLDPDAYSAREGINVMRRTSYALRTPSS